MSWFVHPHVRKLPARRPALLLLCLAIAGLSGEQLAARASATAESPAPRCVPTALNRSDVLPGSKLEVSPLPHSLDASANTQISLLGVPRAQLSHIEVIGSANGLRPGRLLPYSQGDGASFVPDKPFLAGENVTVRGLAEGRHFAYAFTVSQQLPLPRSPVAIAAAAAPAEVQHYHSRPELQPPVISVTTPPSALTAPGFIMAAPYADPGQVGPMIFDNGGQLVWFDPLPSGTEATNLQVQQLEGHPVLTWWQGYIPEQGFGEGVEVIANSAYHQSVVRAGNGYVADLHEFRILPNDAALLTVFNPIRCDLAAVHGPLDGAVTDGVFQEIDLRTGLVRREWHALDHVGLSDSYSSPVTATDEWPFDYFHPNSIDPLANGTILVSARNTSTMYELNQQTLQVNVRIGGRHSTVKLGPGAATAYQHDASELPGGDITVFDNGGVPKVHPQSRGVLLSINPQSGTDTLLAQFTHPTPISSGSQGNIESLPGGDFFVGWGPVPDVSEFSASGQLLFDAHMPPRYQSYRAFRFPWTGTPSEPPAVAVAPVAAGQPGASVGVLDVFASWNGATQVAAWRVYGGASATTLAPVATAPRSGFETTIATPRAYAYIAVQALGPAGEVLTTSKTIKG
jgi:hypothetical protein